MLLHELVDHDRGGGRPPRRGSRRSTPSATLLRRLDSRRDRCPRSASSPRSRGRDASASDGAESRRWRSRTRRADPHRARRRRGAGAAGRRIRHRFRRHAPGRAGRSRGAAPPRREWDFLTRVILGELRTGALEGVLLDAVTRASGQPAADGAPRRDALGRPRRDGADRARGRRRRARRGRTRGRAPGLPMLASTAGSVAEAVATVAGEASVEYKLDGARIQVHRAGDDVQVYTRNLADITHRVPEIVEVVRARCPCSDVILDGETLSLDADGGSASVPGHDGALRLRDDQQHRAAAVVLRRAAPRRARPHRRAARRAARGARAHRRRVAHPGHRHRRRRQPPSSSRATRSRPVTRVSS